MQENPDLFDFGLGDVEIEEALVILARKVHNAALTAAVEEVGTQCPAIGGLIQADRVIRILERLKETT